MRDFEWNRRREAVALVGIDDIPTLLLYPILAEMNLPDRETRALGWPTEGTFAGRRLRLWNFRTNCAEWAYRGSCLETTMPADPPVVLGPEQPWKRLLAMIAFGAIGYVLLPLLLLLAVVQFGFHLWADRSNERITQLADAMKALLGSILDFLLYRSDHLPFPFNPFPESSVPGERFAFSPEIGATEADTDAPSAWQACLRHLSGCQAGGHSKLRVADAVRADDTEALVAIGLRPWVLEGEAHIAFAARHAELNGLFVGTRWQGRAWLSALKGAPGAVNRRIRIQANANPRHAVLIPLRVVLAAFDS